AHLADEPFPERERLGVGIVDAENAHALLDPEHHYLAQRLPQRDAVGAVEIRVDDVLVFLRRVSRKLDRAVRAEAEPFRMQRQPWMVERALHGEIERDLHAELLAGVNEMPELLKRSQFTLRGVG